MFKTRNSTVVAAEGFSSLGTLKRRLTGAIALAVACLLLFAGGVSGDDPHTSFSTAPARAFGGSADPIPDTAGTLRRFDSGLSMTVVTFVTPNTAHTVWWVIFNRPEHCNNPVFDSSGRISRCSAADLSNERVQASLLWATGALVDGTGLLNVNAQLGVGPSGIPGQAVFPGGLTNVKRAEVHLVMRNHGPVEGIQDFTQFQMNGNPALAGQAANVQFMVFHGRNHHRDD